jgi:hypothetical protein
MASSTHYLDSAAVAQCRILRQMREHAIGIVAYESSTQYGDAFASRWRISLQLDTDVLFYSVSIWSRRPKSFSSHDREEKAETLEHRIMLECSVGDGTKRRLHQVVESVGMDGLTIQSKPSCVSLTLTRSETKRRVARRSVEFCYSVNLHKSSTTSQHQSTSQSTSQSINQTINQTRPRARVCVCACMCMNQTNRQQGCCHGDV